MCAHACACSACTRMCVYVYVCALHEQITEIGSNSTPTFKDHFFAEYVTFSAREMHNNYF